MSFSVDLLIIGGGIHGMHLFHLLKQQTSNKLSIAIADPNPEPLHNWKHCTSNSGMQFLRSPVVHHLDIDPLALDKFAHQHNIANPCFSSPNQRPSLELFNAHSNSILSKYNTQDFWIQTIVSDISFNEQGAIVHSKDGEIHAKHVILAIGNGGELRKPNWTQSLEDTLFPIYHIYDDLYSLQSSKIGVHTVIIGNGMGAVQAFIKMAKQSTNLITLLTPNELKISQYDIDPGWMGPKYLHRFHSESRVNHRREMIDGARNRGTITPDVVRELRYVLTFEHAKHQVGRVQSADLFGGDSAYLKLKDNSTLFCDRILLGTGLSRVIDSQLVQKLRSKKKLRCAECGYPIVDPFLRWNEHLIVTGELAELEIGPAAKNIIGARHAGKRIQQLFV